MDGARQQNIDVNSTCSARWLGTLQQVTDFAVRDLRETFPQSPALAKSLVVPARTAPALGSYL